MARDTRIGHRTVPHTADLRIEAWAPTAELCVAEAVRAMVYGFADLSVVAPAVSREFTVEACGAEQQLVSVLDEVIYRMDTEDEIPQAAEVRREDSGLRVTLAMADATRATVIGAVPKAVSLHELWFGEHSGAWRCTVTLDV